MLHYVTYHLKGLSLLIGQQLVVIGVDFMRCKLSTCYHDKHSDRVEGDSVTSAQDPGKYLCELVSGYRFGWEDDQIGSLLWSSLLIESHPSLRPILTFG